jgi:putative phage-type endonuclease
MSTQHLTVKQCYATIGSMLKPIKVENLEQGSPEWHSFRGLGVGSSDASIISDWLPQAWDTMFALSTYKITGSSRTFTEEALIRITRGQELEPAARQAYVELTGNVVEPACFIHPEYPFVRASLDGITEDLTLITEIKCSGSNVYDKVAAGEVPDYYYSQMQHQMAVVPTCDRVHFVMYDPDKPVIVIEVPRDEEFITELMRREGIFWKNVQKKKKMYNGQFGKKIPFTPNYNLLHPLPEQASIEEILSKPETQTQSEELKEEVGAQNDKQAPNSQTD